jgi:hypothetical protein
MHKSKRLKLLGQAQHLILLNLVTRFTTALWYREVYSPALSEL